MIRGYGASLRVLLEHRVLMLIVMAATIALTVDLYIKTPKGYFPQDDTGLIFSSHPAAPDISYRAMVDMQLQGARHRAGRSGGGRRRLIGRRLGLERARSTRAACSSASSRWPSATTSRPRA